MMSYHSATVENSDVRTAPTASDTGISISEYLYLWSLEPPAEIPRINSNRPSVPPMATISLQLNIHFMHNLRFVTSILSCPPDHRHVARTTIFRPKRQGRISRCARHTPYSSPTKHTF